MKKKYLLLTLIGMMALWPMIARSQYIVDYSRQGDVYYSKQNYYAAGVYYQKALNLLPDTSGKTYFYPYAFNGAAGKKQEKDAKKYQQLVYKLGESFRKYKDYKSAEKWYVKVLKFKNETFPLARLWYAVCLRADQKYEAAIDQLKRFQVDYTKADEYSQRAELELKSCRFALDQMKYPRLASVEKLPDPINEGGSNYAPIKKGSDLYFTSSRALKGIDPEKKNPYINKIYHAVISDQNTFDTVEKVSLDVELTTELAAQALSPAATRMYLTQWQQPKKKKSEPAHYVIVMSKKGDNDDWLPPHPLGETVNTAGYDSKEPFITSDGQYLIFSSNRPGGQGGYDLWYCRIDMNGLPLDKAINMGTTINSKKDEVNPYYDVRQKELTFSSNGRIGMGGFDLYKSEGIIGQASWSTPKDAGYPVNSAKDDNFYYPRTPGKENRFYISSDRQSVCCLELYDITLKHMAVTGTLYDCDTDAPLAKATVTLSDSISGEIIDQVVTNETGEYRFRVTNKKPLKLNFSKQKYFSKNLVVTTSELNRVDTLFSRRLCLKPFEVGKPIIIPNILYDFDKATLRPESKVVLDSLAGILRDNPSLIVQMSANTDSIGTDEYNMRLSQQRAESCVKYLITKGIPANRLHAKGYGEARPIAPNSKPDGSDNPAGRQLNRRTEFTVLKD